MVVLGLSRLVRWSYFCALRCNSKTPDRGYLTNSTNSKYINDGPTDQLCEASLVSRLSIGRSM